MKTTIKIHGRDVEFSDTPPTRAGAYWWRHPDAHAKPVLKEVFNPCSDVLIDRETDWQPKDVGGLWSAPLVPVTEVERAWYAGADAALRGCDDDRDRDAERRAFLNSHARHVVEGLE